MVDHGVGATIMLDSTLFFNERTRLAALAAKSQMPVIYGQRRFIEVGGLLSYGASFPALFRRVATYVDKIPEDGPGAGPHHPPPTLLFQATDVIR
jgi:putative tryptophan/tyrosine transport system substrate-binding protein